MSFPGRAGWVALLVMAALGLAPLVARAVGEPFLVAVFTRIAINALAALSLDFILGYGGLVSFGHAAFLGLGAYTVGILSQHAFRGEALFGIAAGPLMNQALVVWPLAMLIAGLFALVVGVISLRTRGVYFIMITLAFGQMLFFLFVSLQRYGGDDGLSMWWGGNRLGPLESGDRLLLFFVAYGLLAVWLVVFWRLANSRFGRVVRGLKQNEVRLQALGYRPLPYQLTAFVLAGMVAGLAGALLANLTEFVGPGMLHWSRSGELMVMVILGGMGTLIGPVLGAAALLLMEEALISYTEHWQLLLGPLLVLIVLFARRGLAGLLIGKRPGE